MLGGHLPVLQVVLPLAAAPVCVIVRHHGLTWMLATLISALAFVISCLLYVQLGAEKTITYAIGGWAGPWGIEYHIDKLTVYMLLIVNGIGMLLLSGGRSSLEDEIEKDRLSLFYAAFLLNLAGLSGIITTGDAFNLFVFIEIASLSSYAMISVSRDRRSSYAAFRYLILGTIGASFILIAVGLLYSVTGTLNIADLSRHLPLVEHKNTLLTALIFFTVGIALKAAMFPLHVWLPDTYSYAPSVVATFFAGTTTKVFIYVLVRFVYSLFGYRLSFDLVAFQHFLMFMACGGILVGSWLAVKQDNLKRLLAYSSIAQLGYIALGISLATELGLAAGLTHIFNHAVIKVALFLSVVSIVYRMQTVSLTELGGLAKIMPFTMACFLLAGLSLIGVPLTAGFISKWYMIQASLAAGYWPLVVLIVFSSVLAVVYIWKVIEVTYFSPVNPKLEERAGQGTRPYLFYTSLSVFVLANLYFGIETSFNAGFSGEIASFLMG